MSSSWPAGRKRFTRLRATGTTDGVEVTFYKSTPFFEATGRSDEPVRVRVSRHRQPGFEFGVDYAEYFDGLPYAAAEPIFEGRLVPRDGRKFSFVDASVAPGDTYAYWVCGDDDRPVGPRPIRVRHRDVWWPKERVDRRLRALEARHPDRVTVKAYGHTSRRRELLGLRAGADPVVGCVGAVHAGESGPELLVPAVERLLREDPELLDDAGIAVLPTVNADERERQVDGCPWYLRTNPNGVDLNRNFPAGWNRVDRSYGQNTADPDASTYRGPEPLSESESRAVVSFVDETRPRALFAFHHMASVTGTRFLASEMGRDDAGYETACRRTARAYVDGAYPDRDRPLQLDFSATAGSLPSWLYAERGVPAFDLEHDGGRGTALAKTDRTTPELVAWYQRRHYRGLVAALRALAGVDDEE